MRNLELLNHVEKLTETQESKVCFVKHCQTHEVLVHDYILYNYYKTVQVQVSIKEINKLDWKLSTDTIYQRLYKSAINFRQAENTITDIINSVIDKSGTNQLRTKQTATMLVYHKDVSLINSSAETSHRDWLIE